MALSFARDEIIWLLRHADNMPKKSADDFIDKYVNFYCDTLNISEDFTDEMHLKARESQKSMTKWKSWDSSENLYLGILNFPSKQKTRSIVLETGAHQ